MHTTKWYTHKPESDLENETHKILCDFEMLTDHLFSTRRQDGVMISKKILKKNKGTYRPVDFLFQMTTE